MTKPRTAFMAVCAILWTALLLPGPSIAAQCTKDSDCKGERICVGGTCQDPTPTEQTPASGDDYVCFFSGGALDGEIVPGVVVDTMASLLERIGRAVLITDLPLIKTGPVQTAAAKLDGPNRNRVILFNAQYVERLRSSAGEPAVAFVIAHELGHHVNADVWRRERDRKYQYEFAADAFAARVLARTKASAQDAQAAIQTLPDSEDDLHPAATERRDRIITTYNNEIQRIAQEQCKEPKYWNGSACVDRCSSGQTWNGSSCVSTCPSGQTYSAGRCVSVCSDGESWNGTDCVPVCPEGKRLSGTRCVSICGSNEEWVDGECVSRGYRSGKVLRSCGCHGFVSPGAEEPDDRCQSGWSKAIACSGWCAAGGMPWKIVCQ